MRAIETAGLRRLTLSTSLRSVRITRCLQVSSRAGLRFRIGLAALRIGFDSSTVGPIRQRSVCSEPRFSQVDGLLAAAGHRTSDLACEANRARQGCIAMWLVSSLRD